MQNHLAVSENANAAAPYVQSAESAKFGELAYAGRLWDAIKTHRRLFLSIAVGFVALTAIVSLVMPKQYTATVKFIVGSTPNQETSDEKATELPVLNAIALQNADLSSETFAELMQEGPVADQVIQKLNLNVSRDRLLGRISVKPVLNTAVLTLAVTWHHPEQAAQMANTFADVFVAHDRDLVRSQAVAVRDQLRTAIADAQKRVQDANEALSRFQAANQITDAPTATQALMGRAAGIELKLDQVRDDEKQAAAQLAADRQQIAGIPATIPGQQASQINPTILALRQQLADAEVALAEARQKYTDQHPTVIGLRAQRDKLRAEIASLPSSVASGTTMIPNPVYQQLQTQMTSLDAQLRGDVAQEQELGSQRRALNPSIKKLPTVMAQLGFLQQRAALASGVYGALQQKENSAIVAANAAISDVAVVAPASADDTSVSPNVRTNVALSIPLGLALATLVVTLLELVQRRIRSDADVQRAIGLPVIGHIPNLDTSKPKALPWLRSMSIEAFLHVCTSLRMRANRPTRTIAITSPSRGDGKSSIAYNVAAAMANIRPPVLILDADLRYPTMHFHANRENAVGLADVLEGAVPLDDAIVNLAPGFDAITAGKIPEHPVRLLESQAFDELLNAVKARYSMVIIDTTAFVPVADAKVVASRADATVVVLSTTTSNEKAAAAFVADFRALGIDNMLGVILNRTEPQFIDYSDYIATSHVALPSAGA